MPQLNLNQYAQVVLQLLTARGARREAILSAYGLTEELWQLDCQYWDREMQWGDSDQSETASALTEEYSQSYFDASITGDFSVLPLDDFTTILSAFVQGTPLERVLKTRGVSLEQFLLSQTGWMATAKTDPSVRAALERALGASS